MDDELEDLFVSGLTETRTSLRFVTTPRTPTMIIYDIYCNVDPGLINPIVV